MTDLWRGVVSQAAPDATRTVVRGLFCHKTGGLVHCPQFPMKKRGYVLQCARVIVHFPECFSLSDTFEIRRNEDA